MGQLYADNYYDKECIKCGSIFIGQGNGWFGLCPNCEELQEDRPSQKQCLYCAKYFSAKEDTSIDLYKFFGVCPDCRKEPKLGCRCDNCGCKISLQQWLCNSRHLCHNCVDELEEE